MIAKFLEREDFEVDFAHTFEEGLKKIDEDYPIVLLDINLGGQESYPILEKAKQKDPKTIIIMVTGRDDEENVQKSRQMGADGFIPKPIMPGFLKVFIVEKIQQIKQQRKFESP